MVSQRRQENGFKLQVSNNNPMNIKGKGDLGQSEPYTTENINRKDIKMYDGCKFFNSWKRI